jgi:hypothetical protein
MVHATHRAKAAALKAKLAENAAKLARFQGIGFTPPVAGRV